MQAADADAAAVVAAADFRTRIHLSVAAVHRIPHRILRLEEDRSLA
jgi:hypothetical protein